MVQSGVLVPASFCQPRVALPRRQPRARVNWGRVIMSSCAMVSGVRVDLDNFAFETDPYIVEHGGVSREGQLQYPTNFIAVHNPKDGKAGEFMGSTDVKRYPHASDDSYEVLDPTGSFRVLIFGRPFFLAPEAEEIGATVRPVEKKRKKTQDPVPFFYMRLQRLDAATGEWHTEPKEKLLAPFLREVFGKQLNTLQIILSALAHSEPFNEPNMKDRKLTAKAIANFRTTDQPLSSKLVNKEVTVGAVEGTLRKIRATGARVFLPGGSKESFGEVGWDRLGGLDVQKQKVKSLMNAAFVNPDVTEKVFGRLTGDQLMRVPKIVMFSGPPGVGKTETAKVLASTANVPLILVETSQIVDMWVGSGEKRLHTIWDGARALARMVPEYKGCIILIDEIEVIVPKRSGDIPPHASRMVATMLQMIQGTLEDSSTMLICCSNFVESIDEAFRSRVSEFVEFGMPDEDARVDIFRKKLTKAYEPHLRTFAAKSKGFSGRDIQNVVEAAGRRQVQVVTDELTKEGKSSKDLEEGAFDVPVEFLEQAIDERVAQLRAVDEKTAARIRRKADSVLRRG